MSLLCVTFIAASIVLPLVFFINILIHGKELNEKPVRERFGEFYSDLNFKRGRQVLIQPVFFLARRYLLALAVSTYNHYLIWQICMMAAQIIMQVNIIGSKVFIDKSRTRSEYFNEFILMVVLYTILCFSPFVGDINVKFFIGYVSIFFVSLHLTVNILSISISTFASLKLKCKRKMILSRFKKMRKQKQLERAQSRSQTEVTATKPIVERRKINNARL